MIGYSLGVGVTIALLSIGGAMLEQSRDRQLFGGGDLVVLPRGLDLETLRTGAVSSLFLDIEQTRFIRREVLGRSDAILDVAPWIEDELVYLEVAGRTVPALAVGEIPSAAAALEAATPILAGTWEDTPSDLTWASPGDSALYAELDRLHLPPPAAQGDSTWAEWYYFNILLPDGWLYLTYMLAGEVGYGEWGGRLLATRVRRTGEQVFDETFAAAQVTFGAGESGLVIGPSSVTIRPDGVYDVSATIRDPVAGTMEVELEVAAPERRYLPPVSVGGDRIPSGYVVPMLDARATGRVCESGRCERVDGARAYHDHNWGVWRDVTWDWGQANTDAGLSILYGGVSQDGEPTGSGFLYLFDSEGFSRVLPIVDLEVEWADEQAPSGPEGIFLVAAQGQDSLRAEVAIEHWRATPGTTEAGGDATTTFYQTRGSARLAGVIDGRPFETFGAGFFETWRR